MENGETLSLKKKNERKKEKQTKKEEMVAGEGAPQFRTLAVLAQHQGLSPSTHVEVCSHLYLQFQRI